MAAIPTAKLDASDRGERHLYQVINMKMSDEHTIITGKLNMLWDNVKISLYSI